MRRHVAAYGLQPVPIARQIGYGRVLSEPDHAPVLRENWKFEVVVGAARRCQAPAEGTDFLPVFLGHELDQPAAYQLLAAITENPRHRLRVAVREAAVGVEFVDDVGRMLDEVAKAAFRPIDRRLHRIATRDRVGEALAVLVLDADVSNEPAQLRGLLGRGTGLRDPDRNREYPLPSIEQRLERLHGAVLEAQPIDELMETRALI